jgi:CARDB
MKANFSISKLKSIATNAFLAFLMLTPILVSSENYNSTLPYVVFIGVDLIIQDLTVVEEGSKSTITFNIKNIGTLTCPDSIRYQLYVSLDGRYIGTKVGFARAFFVTGGLTAGNSWNVTTTYNIPSFATKLDRAYFIIYADIPNFIPETNENNNFISIKR